MTRHQTEAITGLLDGELRGIRRWVVVRHVRACPLCASEYRRQRQVRRLLQANPPDAQMSGSPEFFWSKVKGEIKRRGEEPVKVPLPHLSPLDWLVNHQFTVATATAAVIATVGVIWLMQTPRPRGMNAASAPAPASFARVEKLRTVIPNTTATAVESPDPQQVTVIWVSGLPWTHDMNELKTEFANLDT